MTDANVKKIIHNQKADTKKSQKYLEQYWILNNIEKYHFVVERSFYFHLNALIQQ